MTSLIIKLISFIFSLLSSELITDSLLDLPNSANSLNQNIIMTQLIYTLKFNLQLKTFNQTFFQIFIYNSHMVKGELLYKNGDTYFGQLKNGTEMTGKGLYKFSNGSLFEGQFLHGQFHGKGKLIDQFNGITIISDFVKGKPHGFGKIIYQDQSIYEGEIANGLRQGKGRYIYAERQPELEYQGHFKNDSYEGQGSLSYKNGDYCKGLFKNSLLNGMGEFKNKDFLITGEFKNSLPHGKAKLKYSNGESYEGQFFEGKKQGFGVYTFKDGSVYKGNFIKDCRQGPGQINLASGQTFKGKFSKDEPVEGSYNLKDFQITGDLKNSEFNGLCTIKNSNTKITVDFENGQKNGFLTIVKKNNKGKQISLKSQFKKDKQNPLSISFSERF